MYFTCVLALSLCFTCVLALLLNYIFRKRVAFCFWLKFSFKDRNPSNIMTFLPGYQVHISLNVFALKTSLSIWTDSTTHLFSPHSSYIKSSFILKKFKQMCLWISYENLSLDFIRTKNRSSTQPLNITRVNNLCK